MIGRPPSALQARRHVGAVRAEKRDHGGDLLRLREPPERPPLAHRVQHLLAALAAPLGLLIGQASVAQPGLGGGGPGSDGVAADPVTRVEIGDQPRERQHGGLRDRVVRHPGRGPLARGRGDVHDHAAAALLHLRQRRTDRAHVAHHVQLPHLLPVHVGELLEAELVGGADVVHEHSTGPSARAVSATSSSGAAGSARSQTTPELRSALGRALSTRSESRPQTTTRAPSSASSARGREADPPGRAGDDAHTVTQAEVQGRLV